MTWGEWGVIVALVAFVGTLLFLWLSDPSR